jgi:hypothetical protein
MNTKAPRRRLKFDCPQDWEEMRPMGQDRFCDSCHQPVIDFTTWDLQRIDEWFKQHPGTCGLYLPEQLEPAGIPLDELAQKIRRGLAISLSILAIETMHAQTGRVPNDATEQVPRSGEAYTPAPERIEGIIPISLPQATKPIATDNVPQHRWYLSTRFPFLHKRSNRRVGRIKMRVGF